MAIVVVKAKPSTLTIMSDLKELQRQIEELEKKYSQTENQDDKIKQLIEESKAAVKKLQDKRLMTTPRKQLLEQDRKDTSKCNHNDCCCSEWRLVCFYSEWAGCYSWLGHDTL